MRLFASYLVLTFLVMSCSYFNDPGAELILNVDSEFEISMVEHLIPEGREIKFIITSLGVVNCDESELILDTQRQLSAINIKISDITMTGECTDGSSFPAGEASFSVRNTVYDLAVQIKELDQQMGSLVVTDDNYTVTMPELKGLILERDHLKRIPDDFVWGYYQANKENVVEEIEAFFSAINLEYKPLTTLEPGFYSYFTIDQHGHIQISNPSYEGSINRFAFSNVDMQKLTDLFSSFKTANPDFKITFRFSDGTIL